MKRNLLFHLYPKKESIWRWHVEQLMKYRHVWNARRIVTVVLDNETETPSTVAEALWPLEAEVAFERNDPKLGEARLFLETLGRLRSLDLEEATFYAHGKGVWREKRYTPAMQAWSRAMYVLLLEHPDAVDRLLHRYGAVGCFRHRIQIDISPSCFAGTFFWLRHYDLFTRDWRRIGSGRHGVEGYPGVHFRWEELGSLTPDNLTPQWLYDTGVTDELIWKWRSYWGEGMHTSVIDFLGRALTKDEVSGKSLLEVGSFNVNGTPRSVIDPLKPGSYIGVDSQAGPCVDRIVAVNDLEKEFGSGKFDIVLSTEMLEHVQDWRQAVFQMKSVVKPGGLLILTTRSPGFPYHPYPEDHWRFTEDHFREIFADMDILTLEADVPTHPGVLLKARRRDVGELSSADALLKVNLYPPR